MQKKSRFCLLSFLTILHCENASNIQTKYCQLNTSNENGFNHKQQYDIENLSELWDWLDSLRDIKSVSFCKTEENDDNFENLNYKPLTCPEQCNGHSNARLRFKTQKSAVVEQIEKSTISSKTPGKLCLSILPQIDKISGKFINGTFHGKATLFYHDETRMKVTFSKGVINGLVLIIDKHDELQVFKAKMLTICIPSMLYIIIHRD